VRQAPGLLASLLACACLAPTAHARQSATLNVTFTPNRPGHSTTVDISVQIVVPAGLVPSPLTGLEMRYPRSLGIAVSGLGLATCSQASLEMLGPEGCPRNSRIGQGSAIAEVPFGAEILPETADVAIVRAPQQEGHFALLFYATGITPILAQIIFRGLLLPGPRRSGEIINIDIPLVPSLPEGPDVAIVRLHATLGPRGLTYYEHTHGETIAYHPKGILLPNRCPRGGFPFTATFTFLDGTRASAGTAVRCPNARKARL
jgi:hypothetical protein